MRPDVAIKRVSQERILEWVLLVSEQGQREELAGRAGQGPAGRQRGQQAQAWSERGPRSAPGQVMASRGGAGQGLPEAQHSIGPADSIAVPPQRKGALVLLEPALLWKVSWPGFSGVVRLLDWFEVPEGFALLMEHPQRCQHLWYFLHERRFLTEPVARGLLRQVLEAVRCRSSHGVLLRHIKAENALVHLATGEAKLIDFGCSTILQDTFYTQMSGTPEHLPFHTNEDIIRVQLFFPPRVSQGGDAPSRHEGKNGVEDYTWCPDRTGKRLQHPWSASSASATPGATVCRDSPFQKDEDLVRDRLLSWQQLSRGC
ncbi:serine/threonine-protein kinase pim-3-like [Melozone crissalis]|uniref:serine/threonine-protein kinase pim-3-like n=1 Tax=Melozone crissalis TaxID=40204 RepID=UPI0023DBED00|nr:serine/threonine-protein kinase pim-3-like [Melozone crissalis]